MGNVINEIKGVPFRSLSYHVLLYGINDVGPKLDSMISEETPLPLLSSVDENLPMICLEELMP